MPTFSLHKLRIEPKVKVMSSGHPAAGLAAGWLPSTGVLVMDRSRADPSMAFPIPARGHAAMRCGDQPRSLFPLRQTIAGCGTPVPFRKATNHPGGFAGNRKGFIPGVIECAKIGSLLGGIHHRALQARGILIGCCASFALHSCHQVEGMRKKVFVRFGSQSDAMFGLSR